MKLNFEFLNANFGKDTAIIQEVLEIFLQETSEDLIELQVNARTRDWDSIKHYAHKAKSSFSTLGSTDSALNLQEIETLSQKKENIDRIQLLCKDVQNSFDAIKIEIQDYLGGYS